MVWGVLGVVMGRGLLDDINKKTNYYLKETSTWPMYGSSAPDTTSAIGALFEHWAPPESEEPEYKEPEPERLG